MVVVLLVSLIVGNNIPSITCKQRCYYLCYYHHRLYILRTESMLSQIGERTEPSLGYNYNITRFLLSKVLSSVGVSGPVIL